MDWFKEDKDVQISLMQLTLADKIINHASSHDLVQSDNAPQTNAKELIMNVSNSSLPIEHLRNAYPVFNNLYKSLRFTISDYPLTQTDLFNIHTDTKVLINIFGSSVTIQKALNLYNSQANVVNE